MIILVWIVIGWDRLWAKIIKARCGCSLTLADEILYIGKGPGRI